MEEIPFNRTYFESLATPELIKLADILGLDILDNRERAFVIEELLDSAPLDASFIDGDKYVNPREDAVEDIVLTKAAPLAKQYNISFIEVMVRDPLWAFVFWEIKTADEEQFEKLPDFKGYYLKITPLDASLGAAAAAKQTAEGVFIIPLRKGDNARYLALANTVGEVYGEGEQRQYKVEFCAGTASGETVLAVSNPVRLPAQPLLPQENRLARLSGYGDFQVVRKSERTLRAKGGNASNE